MSLSGSVEDLPLLEILQVVSFCQKTGYLSVTAPEGQAGVVFESGRVVAGFIWGTEPLPPDQPPPGPARDQLVRQRIVAILQNLVRLAEGDFAFHLTATVPGTLAGRELAAETLPYGINPEELMLDLARQLDEDRRDAAAVLEASFAAPPPEEPAPYDEDVLLEEVPEEEPSPAPAAPPRERGRAVLLVDDEPDVLRVVGERLSAAGFEVTVADGLAGATREMSRLAAEHGDRFLVVSDLGLPAGASFRGGLEVVRHASGLARPPAVLLMAETLDEKLRGRAKRLGVSQLAFKPGISKLDPRQYDADLRAFGDKLAADLLPRLASGARPSPRRPSLAPPPGEAARETVLSTALEEIRRSPDPDLVAFLLVRAARAFFPRVLLLLAKDDRLRGLSGFGATDSQDSLDLLARDLSVALEPASPFSEAVASGRAWAGPLPVDGPAKGLLDRIGPLGAREAAILPVRAQRETIAVLYGDAPDGAELPPIEPLVAFVEEAGRALEEALRARRAPAATAC